MAGYGIHIGSSFSLNVLEVTGNTEGSVAICSLLTISASKLIAEQHVPN